MYVWKYYNETLHIIQLICATEEKRMGGYAKVVYKCCVIRDWNI
jgi:hypothetical protein